jgi:exopolysaccharide biosynthesis protein
MLLSSIVSIDNNGVLSIFPKENLNAAKLTNAFQAGPILYKANRKLNVFGDKLRERSVIVNFKNGDIGIFYFSAITLTDMSEILGQISKLWQKSIKTATNLDGGIASSMVVNFKENPVIHLEEQPVKMAILFKSAN